MLNLLLALMPLFDKQMMVQGYYFSYQFGNAILESVKSNPLDGAMRSPFLEFMSRVNIEGITNAAGIFVPVTTILLMTDLDRACPVPPGKVTFLLDKNCEFSPMILERVRYFSGLGFKIAISPSDTPKKIQPFLPYMNYLFFEMPMVNPAEKLQSLKLQYPGIDLVITGIGNKLIFDDIKNDYGTLFDGSFYKKYFHTADSKSALTPLKINYIQLLNVANQDDFDFNAFTDVIRKDTALSINFMRLVNVSNRSGAKIKAFNQAAALLGQKEIKKWIAMAVADVLCADRPSEVIRLSLLRAKFCENLAGLFDLDMKQDNLFLTGLMSILDVVLEIPMEEALKIVFLPEDIGRALLYGDGIYSPVLDFVLNYEQGDWREVSRLLLINNIPISDIHTAYVDAVTWYGELISAPTTEIESLG